MFGSHLSIAGGLHNALVEAEGLGLDTVQIFTKNQRQWAVKPLADEAADEWLAHLDRLGWRGRIVAHDSYLINLASPDDALWAKSIALMDEELSRADRLGVSFLVSHPGAYTSSDADAGIDRIGRAWARLFEMHADGSVVLCLENTAGGGSTLGRTIEELQAIRASILKHAGKKVGDRVGFCIDTCHALAAGYDIRAEDDARAFFDDIDRALGIERVRVLHLNDSKGAVGSRIDRHEHIGKGEVGDGAFAAIVNDPRLAGVPKILETPKGETETGTPLDTLNLRRLRRLLREGDGEARPKTGAGTAQRRSKGPKTGAKGAGRRRASKAAR
ncbi:MAG: deoxyribonuclease IV [Phycisphaerales bacterium]